MQATFRISSHPARRLVRIAMGGFFDLADVDAFAAALRTEIDRLHCPANQHLTFCDVVEMRIQQQRIVAAFARLVGSDAFRSRRLAFVTGTTLARLQTRRLTDRPGVAYFKDPAEAERWLSSEE